MGAKPEKWFSMRTDFYGADAYIRGIEVIGPTAIGIYFGCVAYVCKHNTDCVHERVLKMHAGPRPKKHIEELVEFGFITRRGDGQYDVEYEGTLWRRGNARGDRRAIPKRIRALVYQRDGYACVLCGVVVRLTLDHIHPYSKGGTDEPSNLRVLCSSCNSKKGARTDGA